MLAQNEAAAELQIGRAQRPNAVPKALYDALGFSRLISRSSQRQNRLRFVCVIHRTVSDRIIHNTRDVTLPREERAHLD